MCLGFPRHRVSQSLLESSPVGSVERAGKLCVLPVSRGRWAGARTPRQDRHTRRQPERLPWGLCLREALWEPPGCRRSPSAEHNYLNETIASLPCCEGTSEGAREWGCPRLSLQETDLSTQIAGLTPACQTQCGQSGAWERAFLAGPQ